MSQVPNRQDWNISSLIGNSDNPLEHREDLVRQYKLYMISRLNQIFKWENLPETIPQKSLELLLMLQGKATIADVPNKGLYALRSNLGGTLNAYYLPTQSIVTNPYIPFTKVLEIDKDCIVIRNTSVFQPLNDMLDLYANLLADIDISIRIATINTRIVSLITASDESTKNSAEDYLKKIVEGKVGVILSNKFLESLKGGLNTIQYSGQITSIKDLIELKQYTLASWFNQLGLNANYNMKRESINESEADLNTESLMPLIDDMLQCRQEGAEAVNKMFGTNIKVDLASAWKLQREEVDLLLDDLKESNKEEIVTEEKVENEEVQENDNDR